MAAMTGFKGVGWILGLATVAPACYMVSSQVAAERGRVEVVDRAIFQARHDIRVLETEFDTRANMAQLERWNGDYLALAAPRPDQYVRGGMSLASLQTSSPDAARYAALVVPAATQAPAVVPAVAVAAAAAPAPTTAEPAPARSAPPASGPIATASAGVKQAVVRVAASGVARSKPQAVAMLDNRLLSERTIGDLVSGAHAEAARLR